MRKGITFTDMIHSGMARNKKQAQSILKHALKKPVLFTLKKCRPQQYFPISLKSEIMKHHLSENIPKELTGVSSYAEEFISHSLESYVLPLLPSAPIYIHKLQLKIKLDSETYNEVSTNALGGNKGKLFESVIGKNQVVYLLYPNGTLMVSIENSNNPLILQTEVDRSRILAFLGQVRDRLIMILSDPHERIVPDLMGWQLTQLDVNKDIPVHDWLQLTALKIQVSHLDHLFRLYIKAMGKDTICRVEEARTPKKPVIEAINEIFNPFEKY